MVLGSGRRAESSSFFALVGLVHPSAGDGTRALQGSLPITLVGFKDHLQCNSKGRMNLLLPHVSSCCRH